MRGNKRGRIPYILHNTNRQLRDIQMGSLPTYLPRYAFLVAFCRLNAAFHFHPVRHLRNNKSGSPMVNLISLYDRKLRLLGCFY